LIPLTIPSERRSFETCLASILEIDPAGIPDFPLEKSRWEWLSVVNQWLAQHAIWYIDVYANPDPLHDVHGCWGFHVICGNLGSGSGHCVVGYAGKVFHDPWPESGGLIGGREDWEFGILVPIDPSRLIRDNEAVLVWRRMMQARRAAEFLGDEPSGEGET
jgi:hypothetical protein